MSVWVIGRPVNIESENYLIRSLVPNDATPEYVSWWNDAEIQAGLGTQPRDWTETQAQTHISRFDNRQKFHLGIFPKGETQAIGFFTIVREGSRRVTTNVVIGNKDYWGKAVVKEVRARCLDFIFEDLHVLKVVGKVNSDNYASIFNYKALKYKTEGVLRRHTKNANDDWVDEIRFGLFREEWFEIRKDL